MLRLFAMRVCVHGKGDGVGGATILTRSLVIEKASRCTHGEATPSFPLRLARTSSRSEICSKMRTERETTRGGGEIGSSINQESVLDAV